MNRNKVLIDMHRLSEDERIEIIGRNARETGEPTMFYTDDIIEDGEKKADRYMRKIKEKFPDIMEIRRYPGPVAQVVTVVICSVGAKAN